ncbi:hypothetical protein B0T26DRAFT_489040 [Lasiosphaeria miniovina]|uniref:Uncharacterized protein n=1 Tax=Lasiosphaeria miniovina TaxID=1954250 RepID=A0AA39ZT55_9PEZI|nr:uncharacterized protein B0T26DRAFT_489040 [Lasiosphaeria miniovina]KAK0703044.1 hypothetical protein B0T26DRAFT_489040 [Lasiosphaeria miniovina]
MPARASPDSEAGIPSGGPAEGWTRELITALPTLRSSTSFALEYPSPPPASPGHNASQYRPLDLLTQPSCPARFVPRADLRLLPLPWACPGSVSAVEGAQVLLTEMPAITSSNHGLITQHAESVPTTADSSSAVRGPSPERPGWYGYFSSPAAAASASQAETPPPHDSGYATSVVTNDGEISPGQASEPDSLLELSPLELMALSPSQLEAQFRYADTELLKELEDEMKELQPEIQAWRLAES